MLSLQGGILIKAAHQSEHPTNFVEFSMDEGKCWHYIELSEAIDVISIRYLQLLHGSCYAWVWLWCVAIDTHSSSMTAPTG